MNPLLDQPGNRRRCNQSETKGQRDPYNIRRWQTGTVWTQCNKPQPLHITDQQVRDIVDDAIVEEIQSNIGFKQDGTIFLSENLLNKIQEWSYFSKFVAENPSLENIKKFILYLNETDDFERLLGTIHLLPLYIKRDALEDLLSIFKNPEFTEICIILIWGPQIDPTDDPVKKIEVYINEIELAIKKHPKPPRES